ncbi:heterokaryon incompatibility protein-domain-containing protein [Hyaloscypha finlandica]|nr:heterokaryon incompatibility protein-domain-containing protein [Hyaloscypha finlandica]
MDNGATGTPVKKRKRDQVVLTDDIKFIYDPLDTDFNAIRLLTLLSEDTNDVHCTLEHVSLINPPNYVALSYCWGDPAVTKYIKINGIAVQVTSNLEYALRHLRTKGYSRLWVDAVCINQQDKTERSQQLLWMGSIYRRAKEVIAWTGEDIDMGIDFINRLNGLEESTSALLTVIDSHIGEVAAFLEFLARPYWRRVWIIQELALARHVTIHCGRLEISWSALNASIRKFDHCSETSEIINMRNLVEFKDDAAHKRPVNFLEALGRSSAALSTEPRDKVFALLGLVYDSALYIPVPNYKQSIRDICISMTISAMSTTSSLDIIPVLAPFSDRSLLPSWCPNWFALDKSTVLRQTGYLLRKSPILSHWSVCDDGDRIIHQSTVGTEAKFTVAKDVLNNDLVRLNGFLLDHIATIIHSHVGNGKDISVAADPALLGTSETNPYGTEARLVTIIAKSLACGGFLFEHYQDFLRDIYEYWGTSLMITNMQGDTHSMPDLWKDEEHAKHRAAANIVTYLAMAKSEGVAFMSTRGGYVGWAYNGAEPGDNIYLLAGCSVPVILRPRAAGGYTILGYALVQGVMDGEIMELQSESQETRGIWEGNWVDLDIY